MSNKTGLYQGQFQPCPKKPNCVSSMVSKDDLVHFIEPIKYAPLSQAVARERLIKVLESQERTAFVSESETYLHLTFKTPLMRFTDDIEFYLPPDEPLIHVRSASRIGYSDWGTNRKRLEAIRSAFKALDQLS